MRPFDDRRGRRAEHSDVALMFQLEHVRDRGRLDALVLADEDGLLVAAAGPSEVCEELGAIAPLFGKTLNVLPPTLQGSEVAVRMVHVHQQPLYLASAGGGVARDALLAHSSRGVERILGAN